LSTMAPDDASSDGGFEQCSFSGASRIRPVWSSGSISSMVSGDCGSLAEDDEVEFELDIEAGAVAAREKEQTVALEKKEPEQVKLSPPVIKEVQQAPIERAEPATPIHGKVTPEMSHGLVPKTQNMAEMYTATKDEPPTTLMIRNIPGKYSQNDLMIDLKDAGFGGTYDFLYLPIDKGTAANVGYAFVNFMDSTVAAKCKGSFEGHRFALHQRSSTKLARISVAHLQGLEKNLQHYENAAVNASKERRRRPVVMANLSNMFD